MTPSTADNSPPESCEDYLTEVLQAFGSNERKKRLCCKLFLKSTGNSLKTNKKSAKWSCVALERMKRGLGLCVFFHYRIAQHRVSLKFEMCHFSYYSFLEFCIYFESHTRKSHLNLI